MPAMLLLALRLSLLKTRRPGSSLEKRGSFRAKPRDQLYPLAAGLLKPVPLERANSAEEFVIRLAVLLGLVLDQGELDGAEIIRHLLEAVVGHRGFASTNDPPLKGPCPPSGRALA